MEIKITIPEHFVGKAWLLEQIKALETIKIADEYGEFKCLYVYRGFVPVPSFILRATTLDEGQSAMVRVIFDRNNVAYIDRSINPEDRANPYEFTPHDYIEKWEKTTWSRGLSAIIYDINERLNQISVQEVDEITETVKQLVLRSPSKFDDERL